MSTAKQGRSQKFVLGGINPDIHPRRYAPAAKCAKSMSDRTGIYSDSPTVNRARLFTGCIAFPLPNQQHLHDAFIAQCDKQQNWPVWQVFVTCSTAKYRHKIDSLFCHETE